MTGQTANKNKGLVVKKNKNKIIQITGQTTKKNKDQVVKKNKDA